MVPTTTSIKEKVLPWLEFGWGVAESIVLPGASGQVLRQLTLPARSLYLFEGQLALGTILGGIRGGAIDYARQSDKGGAFNWREFGGEVAIGAAEGGLSAFGSLTGELLSYLQASKLPWKLAPIVHLGLDMFLNEGTSGAGVGIVRALFGKEDDIWIGAKDGLLLGMATGGAFRLVGHGGIAIGRRMIGEFLYRDAHYRYHLVAHSFARLKHGFTPHSNESTLPPPLPWRERNELPRAASLESVLKQFDNSDQTIPIWIQPPRRFGVQNPYSHYREMIASQEALNTRIAGVVEDLRTNVENGNTLRVAWGQRRLRQLMQPLVENYARYAYVASDGGQSSGLVFQHLSAELHHAFESGKTDTLPSILSIVFQGIKENNDAIGHIAQDYILHATFRSYERHFSERLGWNAERLSGISEEKRVNLSCLLTADELRTLNLDEYTAREMFGNNFNQKILAELETMIPHAPGRLRKHNNTIEIKTDAAPGRKATWVAVDKGILLKPSFGLVDTNEAIGSLRGLTKTSQWISVRRRPVLERGHVRDSNEFRREDLFSITQHTLMASLDVAERAKESEKHFLQGIAHTNPETLGRGFVPAGAYLSDAQLHTTLVDILAHHVDKARRADPSQTHSISDLEDSLYLETLVRGHLQEKMSTLKVDVMREFLDQETRALITRFKRIGLKREDEDVRSFKSFLDRSYQKSQVGAYNSIIWFAKRAKLIPQGPHVLCHYADAQHGLLNWLKKLSTTQNPSRMLAEWDTLETRPHYGESYKTSVERFTNRMQAAMADPRNPDNLKAPFWASETMAMLERAQWLASWRYRFIVRPLVATHETLRLTFDPVYTPPKPAPIAIVKTSADGDELRAAMLALNKRGKPEGLLLMGIEGDGVSDFNKYFKTFARYLHDRFVAWHLTLQNTMRKLKLTDKTQLRDLVFDPKHHLPRNLDELDREYRALLNNHYGECMPTTKQGPERGRREDWLNEDGSRRWATLGASGLGGKLDASSLALQPDPEYILRRMMDNITGAMDHIKKQTAGARGRTTVIEDLHLPDFFHRSKLRLLPDRGTPVRRGTDTVMVEEEGPRRQGGETHH